jgi:hypothetical protein
MTPKVIESKALTEFIRKIIVVWRRHLHGHRWHDLEEKYEAISEAADATTDYDSGCDLIEAGIRLGQNAKAYSENAIIYKATTGLETFYQYGQDEDDAIRRLKEKLDAQS